MARQRPTRGAPGLIMRPCIVEIDPIVTRYVQYQFEVNLCKNEEFILKGNFGWAWYMWARAPRIDRIVIRDVQFQFEVNRCRNEKVIVKAILGGRGLCGRGDPGLVMGPCIVEIDRIVIRDVQYQFEINRCRNEEVNVKVNFRWAWSMWAGRPRVGNGAMHNVQYQFEVNRCKNEEINEEIVARTDGRTAEITTISPRFSKSFPDLHVLMRTDARAHLTQGWSNHTDHVATTFRDSDFLTIFHITSLIF
ncbi:hypothetical protein DPMN_076479 [Dreissena polymorpha]|uniref:Uncharacterized protein n=1 Tax=Dreissena polymorpha TaxID=45954 RepID=A0A9D4BFT2_DREPO|nr:hypothetical protein DPMN_076479 [Dreissena polymorpha]